VFFVRIVVINLSKRTSVGEFKKFWFRDVIFYPYPDCSLAAGYPTFEGGWGSFFGLYEGANQETPGPVLMSNSAFERNYSFSYNSIVISQVDSISKLSSLPKSFLFTD